MASKKLLLTGAILAAGLFFFGRGAIRWIELEAQQAQLQSEIATLQAENRRLAEESRRLREDPAYMEAVARRELGFVRPGETVIKLKKKQ
ncbi:MAG: septum formation initiator family protein [Elusimicrobia bacterium]|nr:septum formation initiator family protein [Elusimicrobiota bacterium]